MAPEQHPIWRKHFIASFAKSHSKAASPTGLVKWRKRFGFTQQELAKLLGVSTRMYRYYEAGEREDGRPVAIPTMLSLSISYISTVLTEMDEVTDDDVMMALKDLLPDQNPPPSSDSGGKT